MSENNSQPLEYSTEDNRLRIIGFWTFIGAEIILFGTLFATYFVLEPGTGDGPGPSEIFTIGPVIINTFALLASSFTIGLAINAMRLNRKKAMITFMVITLILGAIFVGVEIYEFVHFYHLGATLQTSGFTAILFLTLGTHGAHMVFGIFWGLGIITQVTKRGLNAATTNKAFIYSLYWHFLDVIWIFIFSFIYLRGLM